MTGPLDLLLGITLLLGCALAFVASIGLHRFPDVFCRMHAATKPATLGLFLVLIAVGGRLQLPGDVVKLVLVAALQLLTAPVGAHMVGRAAYRAGGLLADSTGIDELSEPPASSDVS